MLMKKVDELVFHDGGKENTYKCEIEKNERLYIFPLNPNSKTDWITFCDDNENEVIAKNIELIYKRNKFYSVVINGFTLFNTTAILKKDNEYFNILENGRLEGLTW